MGVYPSGVNERNRRKKMAATVRWVQNSMLFRKKNYLIKAMDVLDGCFG